MPFSALAFVSYPRLAAMMSPFGALRWNRKPRSRPGRRAEYRSRTRLLWRQLGPSAEQEADEAWCAVQPGSPNFSPLYSAAYATLGGAPTAIGARSTTRSQANVIAAGAILGTYDTGPLTGEQSSCGAVRACNRWCAAGRAGRPRRDRSPPRGAPVRRRRPQCHGHAGSPRPRCQPHWLWRSGSCRPRAPP